MTGMITGTVVIFLLFFGMCFLGTGTDRKNMGSYYSYPDVVQERIRADSELRTMIPAEKPVFVTALSNIVIFTIVFAVLGAVLHLRSFFPALWYFLIVGEGLNLFDLLVIDLCWWRNTARTKFKSIPEKALYRDMKKHIASFARGIPVFMVSALVAAGILSAFSAL